MRILVLTFYYEPDLCAGSFRATPFVRQLHAAVGLSGFVDVVTTKPNRYRTFSVEAPETEEGDGLRVRRIALPAHSSGIMDQARSFGAFARGVRRVTRGEQYDIVFATSSRLLTAALAAYVFRRVGGKLYLDLRDIFTETLEDLYGQSAIRLALPGMRWLERRTVRSAQVVNLVSEGFRGHFEAIDPSKRYRFITNGVDAEFTDFDFDGAEDRGCIEVLYAGNIGMGQGLHRIVPDLAEAVGSRYRFKIIGDGGARRKLEEAVALRGLGNVEVLDPVSRPELLKAYRAAHVLFLHLNDHRAFHRVLPSKIFEYAASGKPILAGVAGYAAEFLRSHVRNAAVFLPCDAEEATRCLASLSPGITDRRDFIARFHREKIIKELVQDVLALDRAQAGNAT